MLVRQTGTLFLYIQGLYGLRVSALGNRASSPLEPTLPKEYWIKSSHRVGGERPQGSERLSPPLRVARLPVVHRAGIISL